MVTIFECSSEVCIISIKSLNSFIKPWVLEFSDGNISLKVVDLFNLLSKFLNIGINFLSIRFCFNLSKYFISLFDDAIFSLRHLSLDHLNILGGNLTLFLLSALLHLSEKSINLSIVGVVLNVNVKELYGLSTLQKHQDSENRLHYYYLFYN